MNRVGFALGTWLACSIVWAGPREDCEQFVDRQMSLTITDAQARHAALIDERRLTDDALLTKLDEWKMKERANVIADCERKPPSQQLMKCAMAATSSDAYGQCIKSSKIRDPVQGDPVTAACKADAEVAVRLMTAEHADWTQSRLEQERKTLVKACQGKPLSATVHECRLKAKDNASWQACESKRETIIAK
jgi:hypothetical protein